MQEFEEKVQLKSFKSLDCCIVHSLIEVPDLLYYSTSVWRVLSRSALELKVSLL